MLSRRAGGIKPGDPAIGAHWQPAESESPNRGIPGAGSRGPGDPPGLDRVGDFRCARHPAAQMARPASHYFAALQHRDRGRRVALPADRSGTVGTATGGHQTIPGRFSRALPGAGHLSGHPLRGAGSRGGRGMSDQPGDSCVALENGQLRRRTGPREAQARLARGSSREQAISY